MRILITGGAGFVGSHLTNALLAAGHEVRVLESLEPKVHGVIGAPPAYLNRDAEFVRGDIRDPNAVSTALDGIEAVFHQAAALGVGESMLAVRHFMEVNTVGTAVLLEAMISRRAQFRRLVVASSMAVYGEGRYRTSTGATVLPAARSPEQLQRGQWEPCDPNTGEPYLPYPTDEAKPLAPSSPYACGKRDQEELCICIGRAYDIPTVALRYFNIYGDRHPPVGSNCGIVDAMISRLMSGSSPIVFEDGNQSQDLVHVSDVVQANMLALDTEAMVGGCFNVASGRRLTVLDIASQISKEMQSSLQPIVEGEYRQGDVRHCFADISKLIAASSYMPCITFEDGIRSVVGWRTSIANLARY